ncbi:MAG TPA: hypothetical protein DF774_02115 [Rheinheimera sp.]|uniref:LPD38 domain-containing protein n=1 Tax=Rheinheimera sp. TaxID=1869214 RepID=UPI000ED873F5|nr:LPD38 domain-containing protein [Rheinheimera sp.]HCU64535.1 hypothetical protein [Rheinheimera sp.]
MAINYFARPTIKPQLPTATAPENEQPGMLGNIGRKFGSDGLSSVGGMFDMVGATGIAKQFYGWSDDVRQTMSTEAQIDAAKPFFTENEQGEIEIGEGLTDLDTWLLTMAGVAGQFATTAIPGAGLAGAATKVAKLGATGAKVATAAGMGLTGGAAATGQGMEQARQEYLQMPDEIKAQSDLFRNTMKQINAERPGMDADSLWNATDETIAAKLADDVRKDPATLLANFAGSAIADPIIGKALTGARLAKSGAFRSAAKGFAIEGSTEAAQAGVQEYGVNKALAQVDGRDPTEGVAVAALNEGVAGGAFGASAGAIGGLANRKQPEPVRDPDADAIRDSNPDLAAAFDSAAQSSAQRQADMETISNLPVVSRPVIEGELMGANVPSTFADNQRPMSEPQPFTPYAGQIEDKDIILAADSRSADDRAMQGEFMEPEGQPEFTPTGLIDVAPIDAQSEQRKQAQADMERMRNAPRQITDKNVIFAGDGRPQQAAQEFTQNLQRTAEQSAAVPRLPQKDIIFAGDQSGVTVKGNGLPFQSPKEALASKSARVAKKAGQTLEAVPFGEGFGWRVAETQSAQSEVVPAADVAGQSIDSEWTAFSDDSGTLKIPRAEMPQIKAEHRGAMTQFLKARGVNHEQDSVPATELKPTQAEFSPSKVTKAMGFDGGDRSILVSADGYVLDGHHQWLAKREKGDDVDIIRFAAPISELISLANEFPSSTNESGSTEQPPASVGISVSGASQPETIDTRLGTSDSVTLPSVEAEASVIESSPTSNAAQELPAILRTTKKKYIAQQVKQQKLKESSPGYAQAVARLEEQYESDVDRAQASLTFEQFNTLNNDSPESVNKQAYNALRKEFGLPTDLKFSRVSAAANVVEVDTTALPETESLRELSVAALDYAARNFAGSTVQNAKTGHQITISKNGVKHTLRGAQQDLIKSVVATPELLKQAEYLGAQPHKSGNPSIVATHYYGVKANIGGVVHDIVAVVHEQTDGKRYYDHSIERKQTGVAQTENSNVSLATPESTPSNDVDSISIAETSTTEQPQQLDSKNPDLVRLIGSQLPLSGSPSRGSEQNVLTKDDLVKENPDIQFNRENTIESKPAKGVNPKLAEQLVASIMKRLNGAAGIKVIILKTQAEAESLWQMSLEGDLVRGAFDAGSNTAYIIAENIRSTEELRTTLAHEVIGHGGLKNVVSAEVYGDFIRRLQATRSNKYFSGRWRQIDLDYDGLSESDKAEELFAYYVQNKPVEGPVKYWWNALKRWLHKAFVSVGLAQAGDPDLDLMDDMLESIRAGFMFNKSAKDTATAKASPGDTDVVEAELMFSRTKAAEPDTRTAKEKLGLDEQARETLTQQAKRRTKETIDMLKQQSFWQRLNEGIFDGMAGIKQAEESVGVTDPNKQGYVSARLASGLADVLHAVFNYGAPEWRDGVVARKADTKGMLEVFGMLGDDLNNWLAWMGANRAERLMAEGRENNLTEADIAELKALANGKEELFEQVRQEYNKINSAVITLAEEAGLISPEQRGGFDEEWYVPFFRDMDIDPEMEGVAAMVHGPKSKKGMANQSAKIKELKGGKQSTKDLLENIIQRQSTLIDAALKNKAMLEIVDNLSGTDYMEAVTSPDIAALSQTELNLLSKVKVMRNGQAEAYVVSDPALLRGLLQINDAGSKSLFNKLARGAKRFVTAGITLSPDFIFKNFVRDAAHAWMINKDDFKFGTDSIKGIKKAFKEDELYRDLIFSGAAFQGGYVHGADPEAAAQQIRRTLAAKGLGSGEIESYMDSLVTKSSQLFEKYRNASDKFENANRLSTYEAALAKGKSKRQAAFEAKDLMDYSLKGNFALIGTMIDMLPFFNARLQGMSKLVRAARAGDGDRVLKVLSANLAMKGMKVAAFSLALAAMNDDDERYKELPDFDKDGNWHFWIGDDHFRIPKPFELGIVFGTIPERMLHFGTGSQPASDLGKSVAHAVFNTLALNPIPQIALPVVEVMTNRSFFKGSAIEGMADENKQAQDRYNAYTSDIAKMIGEAFGVSPKKVEHIVTGYTGTIGGYVLGLSDIMARQMLGIEKADTPISRYPVIKAFYQGDAPKTATKFQDEFYDAMEAANQAYGSYKRAVEEGDVVRQQELKKSESKALGARVQLARVQRKLSELSKQAEMVNNNNRLSSAQKREKLDDITRQKNALYSNAYVRHKLGEW